GREGTSFGPPGGDVRRLVLELPGPTDPTLAACTEGQGFWSGGRGARWINGQYGDTLYNHFYGPNARQWDCSNGFPNKGLTAARSWHAGGVNMLLCDGSVTFVSNNMPLKLWRAFSTRAGGEVPGKF